MRLLLLVLTLFVAPAFAQAPVPEKPDAATLAKLNAPGAQMVTVRGGKYKVWAQKVGDGPIKLLLLHGGPGTALDYLENFPVELGEKYTVYFHAQLGTYLSDAPEDESLYTIAQMVEEVEDVRAALGLENFYLYGHSWGFFLGASYAAKYPQHLKGLILSNASIFRRGRMQAYQLELIARIAETLPEYKQYADQIRYGQLNLQHGDPELVKQIWEKAMPIFMQQHFVRMEPWPEPVARAQKNSSGKNKGVVALTRESNNANYSETLAAIKTPTLLLGAKYDAAPAYDYVDMRTLIEGGGNEKVDIEIMPNGGHFSMWDDTENYFAAIRKFVDKTESAK